MADIIKPEGKKIIKDDFDESTYNETIPEVSEYSNLSGGNIVEGGTLGGWRARTRELVSSNGLVGLSSEVTSGTDWRFWAGNTVPASAPFRVDEDGNLVATSATISGTITVGSLPNLPSDSSLVCYWSMDEGSGEVLTDFTANGYNIDIFNTADWQTGISGGCLSFDGISKYAGKSVNPWGVTDIPNISISCWFKFDDFTTDYTILDDMWDSTARVRYDQSDDWLEFRYQIDGAYQYCRVTNFSSTYSANTWYHFAGTIDAITDGGKAYIDGVEVASDATTGTDIDVSSDTFLIGRRGGVPQEFFSGDVDEVRGYNVTLTENEVKALYLYPNGTQQQGVASDKGLIAGWTIDSTTLSNGTDITLDASNKAISINDTTFGNQGIQLEYNGGTPRAYIGDGGSNFLEFDGTTLNVSGTIAVGSFPGLPSDDDLLGYWSLDEGSGSTVSDYSSADNAGTITGGTFVVGVSGTALDFNGVSQYVDLGASIVVGTMSVSMWVNFDDITRTEFMMIGTDTDTKNWFYLSKGAGNLSYGWRYDDAGVDKRENFAYSGLISNDTWHHFVAVVDSVGGTHKFYIDGVEANTATSTYTVGVVESPTYISRDNATQAMDGTIDEVRIYDRVLTVNEVKALYLNPNGIQQQGVASDRGLIAGWTINSTTLSNGTNIILDASNKAISINDATYGNSGVQIEYNAGTPRMYIGDGSTKFFEFDGTNAIVGGDSFISLTSADDIQFRANNELVNKVFRGNANDGLTEAGTEVIRYPLDTYIRDGRIYSGQINRVETWSMDMQYTVVAETDSLTAQDVFLGLISQAVTTVPANSTSTARHIGFMIEDGTLYASVADGTTQTKSAAITGYTLTDEIAYRISWDNGTNARFYVKARGTTDYTLEATLSSNIPSGTGADDPQVLMGISGSAGARSMIINNNYLIIDAI